MDPSQRSSEWIRILLHIGYSSTPSLALYLCAPSIAIPHVTNGKLKAIAISGENRHSSLPQVPTFAEAGLPGFDAKVWFGILAPAGTPKGVIDKLSTEVAKILAMSDMKEKLAAQGLDTFISSRDQFAALLRADMAKFAKIIKTANIKLEN